MDHYNDTTNGFLSINIKSTAAKEGRVTSRTKINQLFLLWLNYTATVLYERNEQKFNTRES